MKFNQILMLRRLLCAGAFGISFVLSALSWSQEPVDINLADAQTLTQLKNVGEKKAQAIVEYRETNGKFETVDDLTKVKGIGQDTLEDNRANLIASQ